MFRFESEKQFEVDRQYNFLPPLLGDAFDFLTLERNLLPCELDCI
jgi:hypothetical protein